MQQQIRELAYRKWTEAGYPPGDGINFWLEAEAELAEGGIIPSGRRASKEEQQPEQRAAKKSNR